MTKLKARTFEDKLRRHRKERAGREETVGQVSKGEKRGEKRGGEEMRNDGRTSTEERAGKEERTSERK